MPLSERDYMREARPPSRIRKVRYGGAGGFGANPVLIIILINFLLLIATLIGGKIHITYNEVIIGEIYKLNYYLGLMPAKLWERPWTIVTSMFVHAGPGHFFGNMLTFFFFGRFLSRLVGDNKLLIVYFGGGMLGSILYLLLAPPLSVAVGASGAVYAIAGMLVMLQPNLKVLLYFIIPMPLWVVVLVFFVLFSIPGFIIPGVAWQAHLGGLIFGLAAGYIFKKREGYYRF